MNESPWISIIIPVYNAGQYFEECLQTVCGNTQLDIEIILIDDGSTDGSGNTARKWAAKDVRVRYIQQENQGCSSARNHGIELARGKWIMFVDADDTIEPDTMKKLRVLEPKFEDAEIVCFGCHMNLPENMTELHKLESAITEELALSACGVRRPENGLPETNFASMCWKLYRGDFLRRTRDAVFQKKLQAFANQYRYWHLEQIGASYSALNGIAVSFEAYFSFFRLAEYRVFRLELTNFLQKDCYQKYLKKKCPGAQYLNRNSKILIFLLAHRMYFLSWLLFGVGRKIKRTLDTVSKS